MFWRHLGNRVTHFSCCLYQFIIVLWSVFLSFILILSLVVLKFLLHWRKECSRTEKYWWIISKRRSDTNTSRNPMRVLLRFYPPQTLLKIWSSFIVPLISWICIQSSLHTSSLATPSGYVKNWLTLYSRHMCKTHTYNQSFRKWNFSCAGIFGRRRFCI